MINSLSGKLPTVAWMPILFSKPSHMLRLLVKSENTDIHMVISFLLNREMPHPTPLVHQMYHQATPQKKRCPPTQEGLSIATMPAPHHQVKNVASWNFLPQIYCLCSYHWKFCSNLHLLFSVSNDVVPFFQLPISPLPPVHHALHQAPVFRTFLQYLQIYPIYLTASQGGIVLGAKM